MIVFVINGRGGAGKDQFVKYFTEFAGEDFVLNISTVDYIKEIASSLGWDGIKDNLSRKYLSDLKDMATYWGDIPFNDVYKKTQWFDYTLKSLQGNQLGFVFIHCREPKEIQRIKEKFDYDVYTILIRRDMLKFYGNHADDEVENYTYDFTINNFGTLEELRTAAEKFYNKFHKAGD